MQERTRFIIAVLIFAVVFGIGAANDGIPKNLDDIRNIGWNAALCMIVFLAITEIGKKVVPKSDDHKGENFHIVDGKKVYDEK